MRIKLTIFAVVIGLQVGCVTTTPQTVKTMSSEFLCEMLGPAWIATKGEQEVIREELLTRDLGCDYGRLRMIVPPQVTVGSARTGSEPRSPVVSSGTCFAVSPNGVLTSHHVVANADRIEIRFGKGEAVEGAIVRQSRASDLAVLRVAATPAFLDFAPDRSIILGQQVFTLGFPATSILGDDTKFTEGSISSLSGVMGDASFFQMSVPVQPGNSGGPVVNLNGEVVGVVAATAAVEAFYSSTGALPQNVNWASKIENARVLLDSSKRTADQRAPLDRAQVIEHVNLAVCQVHAFQNE
jgi:S1-C subfamily serine protease